MADVALPTRFVPRSRRLRPVFDWGARAAVVACVALAVVAARPGLVDFPLSWVIVAGESMEPALHSGDIAFVLGRDGYRAGDVAAYRVPAGEPGAGVIVIHRIVGGSPTEGYVVQGDNKSGVDPWRPRDADIVGRMVFHLPKAGLLAGFLRTPLGMAWLAGLVTFIGFLCGGEVAGVRRIPQVVPRRTVTAAVPKRAAAKTAAKRAAATPAPKRAAAKTAPKRSTSKAAPKGAAAKPAAQRTAAKPAPKRTAKAAKPQAKRTTAKAAPKRTATKPAAKRATAAKERSDDAGRRA